MDSISVNLFREKLKFFVEKAINTNVPIKVTRRSGKDFVVLSAEDWDREQETLYVLQNTSLMKQIAESLSTHNRNKGYTPTKDQMNEITGF
ncbi:MAG: type II toxin-antitoxin system Phd/YefM family antitoxin [Marinoscillum sp.]